MNFLGRVLKPHILQSIVHYSRNKKINEDVLYGRGNMDQYFPSDFSEDEKEDIGFVQAFTMTSLERLVGLSRAVDYLINNQVTGDIVECGVWKGGSMMLIAKG
jgi:hypothetical protein